MAKAKQKPEVFCGTAAEYRAMLDARRPYALAVYDAVMRRDHDGCAEAQKVFREAFPNE